MSKYEPLKVRNWKLMNKDLVPLSQPLTRISKIGIQTHPWFVMHMPVKSIIDSPINGLDYLFYPMK